MTISQPWKAIARSVIGSGHVAQNLPCQDYSEYRTLSSGILIGAVADGAGSASWSHLGAALAVKTALNYLEKWHLFFQRHPHYLGKLVSLTEPLARRYFQQLVRQVQQALFTQANALNCPVEALATTLLVFVASEEEILAMQIGDGFVVIRSEEGDYQLLFHPDKGEFINETTFVTSPQALNYLQVRVVSEGIAFICAATDGVEKVAIRYRDWIPFAPFFEPLEAFLREAADPEQESDYVEAFLNSERLNQRTQDDKTLLLCLLNQGKIFEK